MLIEVRNSKKFSWEKRNFVLILLATLDAVLLYSMWRWVRSIRVIILNLSDLIKFLAKFFFFSAEFREISCVVLEIMRNVYSYVIVCLNIFNYDKCKQNFQNFAREKNNFG